MAKRDAEWRKGGVGGVELEEARVAYSERESDEGGLQDEMAATETAFV